MSLNRQQVIDLHIKAHGFPPSSQFLCWWKETTDEYRSYFTRLMNDSAERLEKNASLVTSDK